jgi:hypothetical protein
MPWYGPRGNCGCCGDVIVPCECGNDPLINDGPCTPEDPGYFRNVAVEISELPAEITWRLEATLNPCAGYECQAGEPLFNLQQRKIAGINQFNGTYPGTHYYYDADTDEYYEAEATDGCGFWGYSNVTKTLRLEVTRIDEYDNVGCISRDLYGEVEFDVTFDPVQGGIIPPSYPIPKPGSWPFNLVSGDLNQPLLPALTQAPYIPTDTSRWFAECSISSDSTGSGTVVTNDPIVRFSSGGVTITGAAVDPTSSNPHNLETGVVGGLGGSFPSSNFPPGVQMLNANVCALNRIETVFEYSPFTQRITSTIGGCDREYGDRIFSGWSIRRKLLYDGRRAVP